MKLFIFYSYSPVHWYWHKMYVRSNFWIFVFELTVFGPKPIDNSEQQHPKMSGLINVIIYEITLTKIWVFKQKVILNTHTYSQKFYIDISNVCRSEFHLASNVPFFELWYSPVFNRIKLWLNSDNKVFKRWNIKLF